MVKNGGGHLVLENERDFIVGKVIQQGQTNSNVFRSITITIDRDPLSYSGYRIQTAYPKWAINMENINYLLSAYYHQDWFLEKSNPLDIIDVFIKKETKERVDKLRKELVVFLEVNQELPERFLLEHGGYYLPSADGLTVREWLEYLLNKLRFVA